MRKCLNPQCDRARRSRGLCVNCYQAALRLVRIGRTTWASLEKSGKVEAPQSNSKAAGPIAAWLLGSEEVPKS